MMKVFIGSSKEQLENAKEVALWLARMDVTPILWDDNEVFPLAQYTWDALCNISAKVDAAIFIFGEDDKIWYRNSENMTVRDNVFLEYGLFSGKKGSERVSFLFSGNPKIATDLRGITGISIENTYAARTGVGNWINQVKRLIEQEVSEQSNVGNFKVVDLAEALQTCISNERPIDHLRVFAISTSKSVQTISLRGNLNIKTASIMLREYPKNDWFYEKDMESAIDNAIKSWKHMVENGKIKKLRLSRFNYHPDEGFYIIDNRYLIIGYLNHDARTHVSEFENHVILIDNTTEGGKKWIKAYIKRFNKIESNYETECVQQFMHKSGKTM